MLITRNCFNYITSALGNSFNLGLLWAFSSIMVLSPWCGSNSKWFLPTFLKLRSFKNDQSLMNFSATYKSFKLFRGINASSWISEMLFFSRSLKRIFIIVNTTFFTVPFKWIAKIWVVFKLSFRKRKYFSFSGKSSAFLCWENSFSYIHLQFCLILWPKSRALDNILNPKLMYICAMNKIMACSFCISYLGGEKRLNTHNIWSFFSPWNTSADRYSISFLSSIKSCSFVRVLKGEPWISLIEFSPRSLKS